MSNRMLNAKMARGFYPEQILDDEPKLDKWVRCSFSRFSKAFARQSVTANQLSAGVNRFSEKYGILSEQALLKEVESIRAGLRTSNVDFELVTRCFALIREVADRRLGMRHYDVQLYGGWILSQGMVAEMNTGEGKTLTATLPACVAALIGLPVHIVTVNDYLASRDAEWMRPIYEAFGLTVGVVMQGMDLDARRQAYDCDITYCTNKELVFDYLKDRLVFGGKPNKGLLNLEKLSETGLRKERLLLRGLGFALVDEVDSILIDEARTPLIISGQGDSSYKAKVYRQALDLAGQLDEDADFELDRLKRRLTLKDEGKQRLEHLVEEHSGFWKGKSRREELIRQALTAIHLFHKDRDYLLKDGRVQIIDEFTGRTMQDRSWEQGLHQLIETKEDCELTTQKETLARISYQRFFRRYKCLSGMTGTAKEVANELWSVYHLNVVSVPSHKQVVRQQWTSQILPTEDAKWETIIKRIDELHNQGRPVLVGTRSVEASERLAERLSVVGLPHRVLNARQDQEEAAIIASAGQGAQITVATNMAGRGTDIALSEDVRNAGGLHVIATERHSARRIDRQLFGRCGRQGDPGSCESIVSLEDELLLLYQYGFLGRLCNASIPVTQSWRHWLCKLYASYCQWATERKHFQMRRELLDLDEMQADALAFSGRGE